MNADAIDDLVIADIDLFVTVDCGTTAHDLLDRANDAGIDVLVSDRHNHQDLERIIVSDPWSDSGTTGKFSQVPCEVTVAVTPRN